MSDLQNQLDEQVNGILIEAASKELKTHIEAHKQKIDPSQQMKVVESDNTLAVILPKGMNKLQACFNLLKQFKEEETFRTYNRKWENIFMNDFMVALHDLIPKYFGALHVSKVTTKGHQAADDYIQFPVGYKADGTEETAKGYVGSILAPVWENAIIDITPCSLAIRAKLKYDASVNRFMEDLTKAIRVNSVVNGKMMTPTLVRNAAGAIIGLMAKPFIAKENKRIVLNDNIKRQIDNIIIPTLKLKMKKSLLFAGDFGTGKTETAIRVGIEANKRYQRTFFYLDNADMFTHLLPYLKNYDRAIVFVEDIDQISSGDRDTAMNDLLNQIDGSEVKNIDCTFIFSTNSHNKIHPAMRRPGRIDQVIFFDYPDKDSIAKIYELWAEGVPGAENVDYALAAEKTPDNVQGAVISEIGRRAVWFTEFLPDSDGIISTDKFLDSIATMVDHIKFMKDEQVTGDSAVEMLAKLFQESIEKAYPNHSFGAKAHIE